MLAALLGGLTTAGCGRRPPAIPPSKAPEVIVSKPVVKEVTDYAIFSGRTEAVAAVEVRARVSGYLDKVLFKEGADVEQGQPLFEIDPRTYAAELKRAEAAVQQGQAQVKLVQSVFKRATQLLPANAISQDDYDRAVSARDEASATLKLAEAALDLARLNLGFTKVIAPISGRISKQLIDPGNMVKADETALTTIVALDPIYATFYPDEHTVLQVRRLIQAGKVESSREAVVPVFLQLADEESDFPHEGTVNFVDNQMDPMTGTVRLRGIFPNPKQFLAPGFFARIKLRIGAPHPAVLISQRAFGSDQGQTFVYVVNDKNEIEYRRVKVGDLHEGLAVVKEGLAEGERVVISGLQRVRAGIKVEPKMVESAAAPLVTAPESAADKRPAS
jgi:RND family efflux transporter MFP subunit